MNYFYKKAYEFDETDEISSIARYAFMKIVRMKGMGTRLNFPSKIEINAILELKQILFPIYFFNGARVLVPIEPYTTV